MASHSNSLAASCLLAALDESGLPRKSFASDCGLSEGDFSKSLSSHRFDIRWLDDVPPVVALAWLEKYALAKFGAELKLPAPEDLLQRVLAEVSGLVGQVRQAQQLAEIRSRKGAA